jgi:hypothetical protein
VVIALELSGRTAEKFLNSLAQSGLAAEYAAPTNFRHPFRIPVEQLNNPLSSIISRTCVVGLTVFDMIAI